MLFNSLDFMFFFPIVFTLYWVFSKNLRARNVFILVASYVFYGWWDWRFLFLIVISSAVDFYIGRKLGDESSPTKRKLLLYLSLAVNLGFLLYFKYFNFFIESFVDAFTLFGKDLEVTTLNVILPVGISFYTFQTLSYSIDIYNNKLKPTSNLIDFFAFVAFFPQLVAGPIERASHLLPQFSKHHLFDYNLVRSGLQLMLWGLFKKMVIADRLALFVNEVYNNPEVYSGTDFTIATLFFTFQIYCDFSGYSDIAIGAARTMGFDLMKNFDAPYLSRSITEFWRRWHISLSTWFRDYVYIPMGGSRIGKYRTYINLLLVFLISGLWHGAAMTFIIWGAIHGCVIVIEKALKEWRSKRQLAGKSARQSNLFIQISSGMITFTIVFFAWIFFRARDFHQAIHVLLSILSFESGVGIPYLGLTAFNYFTAFGLIVVLILIEVFERKTSLCKIVDQHILLRWSTYITGVFAIILYGIYGENAPEFIYFQF